MTQTMATRDSYLLLCAIIVSLAVFICLHWFV